MAGHGAYVVVNYHRSKTAAFDLCEEIDALGVKALPVQADVTREDQVNHLVAEARIRFGRIDILVNNFGPYVDNPFLELATADFDAILAGNLRATFLMTKAVGPLMKSQGSGQIINIAATDFKNRSHSVYGLAKSGLIYLSEALALEMAPEVRVNVVAPDLIADNEDMTPELVEDATSATPLGRLVTRAEVAGVVCALCTSPFNMVTGETIVMDGGRSIPRIAVGPIRSGRHS
jgi:NAD(P)-dependent dehydrogenase (short-subunit alcohol dehydrogenase family)